MFVLVEKQIGPVNAHGSFAVIFMKMKGMFVSHHLSFDMELGEQTIVMRDWQEQNVIYKFMLFFMVPSH